MRGKATTTRYSQMDSGITPAYAGKRKRNPNGMLQSKDHPRLCGEKRIPSTGKRTPRGSPPPMRGKATNFTNFSNFIGITPAYAGKSNQNYSNVVQLEDHPRLCGEKSARARDLRHQHGSPPPMRGKVLNGRQNSLRLRITPAYAGKSGNAEYSYDITRDHPRLCGEKSHFVECSRS